jgi:hypothetical protein
MMKLLRSVRWIFLGTPLLFLVPCFSLASTIPITGNASMDGDVSASFQFSGPSLSLFSGTVDLVPGDITGNKIPASYTYEGFVANAPQQSGGTVDGVTADVLAGVLTVDPDFGPGNESDVPATASGLIYGYQVISHPGGGGLSLGNLLWTVDINAAGTLTEDSEGADVTHAHYTFTSGTAAVTLTPEPASLLLFATGLVMLSLLTHRQMKKSKRAAV